MTSEEEDTKAARRGGWRVILGLLVLILAGAVGVALWQGVDLGRTFQEARKTTEEAATTARVKAAFMLSNRVSAFDIDVDTEGGEVTLRGQVPANEIRELAEAIAEDVAGRAAIRNELAVVPGVRPDSELEELRRRVGELEIETSVMAALANHPRLREKDIRVDVAGDRVTLEGSTDHAEDRLGAERLAQATEGVQSVVNDIVVEESRERLDGPGRDESLARRIEFALYASDVFDLEEIDIRVNAGSVTLAGMVRSRAEVLLAERIARDVEDVQKVTNALEVAADPVMSDADRAISH